MAAVNGYTKLLLHLSEKLRDEELRKAKFALRGTHISERRAEKITTGFELFKALEERDVIDEGQLDILIQVFETIERRDLVSKINEYLETRKGFGAMSVTDGPEVPQQACVCTASAYQMQPPETDHPVFSGCTPKPSSANCQEEKPRFHQALVASDSEREYRNFMMLDGYAVQIVGGKHFCTPQGEFVEMTSGQHFSILVRNTHREGCNVDVSIDGFDVGGWELMGKGELAIERSVYDDRRFTFYREKLAPADSGIEAGRPENGLVSCVFTPEAHVSVLVKSQSRPEPQRIEMAPYATVRDLKQEAQRRLGMSVDPEQILSRDEKVLDDKQVLRDCGFDRTVQLTLLSTELQLRVETSTGQTVVVSVNPGRARVIHVMEEIERHTDTPVEDQKLYHGEAPLSDTRWAALPHALFFSDEPRLFVELPTYCQLTVRIPGEDTVTVKIDPSKTLMDLVRKLPPCAEHEGTRVWFVHNGKRLSALEERGSLESYGVVDGAVMDVELEVEFIAVSVVSAGREAKVKVPPGGTLGELLQKVPVCADQELGAMAFTLDGNSVRVEELTASLQGLGVRDGSVLRIQKEGDTDSGDEWRDDVIFQAQMQYEVRRQSGPRNIRIVNESLIAENAEAAVGRVCQVGGGVSWRPGGVTLQGHSDQQFHLVDRPIKVDPSRKVTLTLRLVAREDEQVGPFPNQECRPLSSLVPPPVFDP